MAEQKGSSSRTLVNYPASVKDVTRHQQYADEAQDLFFELLIAMRWPSAGFAMVSFEESSGECLLLVVVSL